MKASELYLKEITRFLCIVEGSSPLNETVVNREDVEDYGQLRELEARIETLEAIIRLLDESDGIVFKKILGERNNQLADLKTKLGIKP